MLISEITALVKCSSRIKRMQGPEFVQQKAFAVAVHAILPRNQPDNITSRLMVRPGITGWAQINGGHEERLFTLRAIADHQQLKWHGCGGRICLSDRVYESLVSDVRNLLEAIDAVHAAPVFNGQPALTSPLGHNAFGTSMIGGR
jgi:hypothetical protein